MRRRTVEEPAWFTRAGDLDGLGAVIAELIETNLRDHPDRAKLLRGKPRWVTIRASDLDLEVGVMLGAGGVTVAAEPDPRPALRIETDSGTLIDLPNAKLALGLPSALHSTGRVVLSKMLKRQLKIRPPVRLLLVSRLQRLLSVA